MKCCGTLDPLLEQSIVRATGSGNEDYVLSPRFTLRCQGYFARRHTTVRSQRVPLECRPDCPLIGAPI